VFPSSSDWSITLFRGVVISVMVTLFYDVDIKKGIDQEIHNNFFYENENGSVEHREILRSRDVSTSSKP